MQWTEVETFPGVIHDRCYVDPPGMIRKGTRILHFNHIQSGTPIGDPNSPRAIEAGESSCCGGLEGLRVVEAVEAGQIALESNQLLYARAR